MIAFTVGLLLYAACGITVLKVINEVQGKPYMDEIFHIPQAQQYCHGNLSEWDPMITTLPGLYLMSAGVLVPVARLLQVPPASVCSTLVLRGVNLLFMLANVCVLYLLAAAIPNGKKKNQRTDSLSQTLQGLCLGLYPVLYFFTFLYYTDPGSVLWVLLMYLACLRHAHVSASICGAIAIMFRQTNIIWVVFMAGIACEKDVFKWLDDCKQYRGKDSIDKYSLTILKPLFKCLSKTLIHDRKKLFNFVQNILKTILPYMFIVLLFVVFVYINNGIVVGDRSHHQACLNFPQVFYFLSTCLVFSFMHLMSRSKIIYFFKFLFNHHFLVSIFVVAAAYLISNFTYVHEYLLADNRHYPFYVWSKIYRRHELVKFLLVPMYCFALISFSSSLSHKTIIWRMCFWVCLVVTLVPQKLLEFRYFVIPFYIWRLNINDQSPSKVILVLELLYFLFINAAALYMFLYKPFHWPDSNELQRFMW
ncbi:putative Dol-P-Glc:Glc(2)Man(9)GlcNAc(2)-PP-Dol alpha-1,2-glucosyltransferase [Haliotis rufescens]|uniref:putative Dol-P-Glc:Glc(2)Man(9)GlcNAc(2)-PP-Dol alpha-1,2-glucosyltransferase n=1 Tax=Haliotis rufescens TaxID=6454 RepID=UPI00201EBEF8|nr:putative Dol-P-Glc:Glc(2)Man(9)GlcNAc(2)-PP-Dol alpha-1,2-glucosyltransferase [Haliotis rufescens]